LANAEKLITQLAAVNIKASAEAINVGGKSLFRVVAKGYGTRANAEAARLAATTSINGLNASILQGELSSDSAPASVVAPALQSFAVQIGVYGDKAKADQLIAQLKAKGFPAFAERVITPSGSTIRVRVGPILKRADAEKSKADIKAKLGLDSIIVPFP
jgi:cell division septation protein DedD